MQFSLVRAVGFALVLAGAGWPVENALAGGPRLPGAAARAPVVRVRLRGRVDGEVELRKREFRARAGGRELLEPLAHINQARLSQTGIARGGGIMYPSLHGGYYVEGKGNLVGLLRVRRAFLYGLHPEWARAWPIEERGSELDLEVDGEPAPFLRLRIAPAVVALELHRQPTEVAPQTLWQRAIADLEAALAHPLGEIWPGVEVDVAGELVESE